MVGVSHLASVMVTAYAPLASQSTYLHVIAFLGAESAKPTYSYKGRQKAVANK